jgi:hypothetical protein
MTHEEKIKWMIEWAHKHKLRLELEGECGFGRECVGVIAGNENYPDYEWYDKDTYERVDPNGDVWVPEDAYHKCPCVAVLGRGEPAEAQLYDWLVWFDANGFELECVDRPITSQMELLLGRHRHARMVKKVKTEQEKP